ncbi:hypothetical protein NW761_015113 [Fusarium oxysporum]|nr:hypothetical protein NW758_014888 [Fusarium oxysporum]KAJ4069105.1 hypothetical protein NW761_015113 [Fusarium oxysporum]WKT53606.1 Alpha/beta hydrolase fold-3 [Fusarium oxysporum f. sp. vasinfectum]
MAPSPTIVEDQRSYMRQFEDAGLEFIGPCPTHLNEATLDIPLSNGRMNRIKVVWPKSKGSTCQCPLIIYFHGGGYVCCSPDQVLAPARGFAQVFNAVVVCPSLNQLPEQRFPAPIKIGWEVCAWLSNTENLNDGLLKHGGVVVDLTRGFVIGGLSAGGSAAAVLAALSAAVSTKDPKYEELPPLRHPFTGAFVGLPFLITEAMLPERFSGQLRSRRDPERTEHIESLIGDYVHTPWFSPVNIGMPTKDIALHHPPKVFVYCTSLDVFRDDAIIYYKWLSGIQGVEARLVEVPNEDHTAWVSPPWPASHTRMIKEMTLSGMAWLLDVEWDQEQDLPA